MRSTSIATVVLCSLVSSRAAWADEGPVAPGAAERAPVDAPAEDPVGWQLESGVASTYVFRGRSQYLLRRDPSSQTTVALTVKKIGPGDILFGLWNATSLSRAHPQPGTALELDVTAGYALGLGKHVVSSWGYTSYLYPKALTTQHVDGAHELYGTLALADGFVTPTIGVYGEVARLKGAYVTAGVSKTFTIRKVGLTPQASVGAAGYAASPTHLNDVSAAFVAQWTFLDTAYVNARIACSYMGGKAAELPTHDDSLTGRSVPWGMIALGVQR